MWAISGSFVYTELLGWEFPHSQRVNLTYCLKSCLLICFPCFCMVDQTKMCPSFISPLGIFQEIICNRKIICNIKRLKGKELGTLNYRGDLNWRSLFIPCVLVIKICLKICIMLSMYHVISRNNFGKIYGIVFWKMFPF